jgi:ATP-dependent helicase HrpB
MDRLELKRISRASATQRAGRAGRTRPGKCIRLWSAIEDKSLEPFESPEVKRVDLTQTVLALHAWGHSDPRKFEWYEPPDERTLLYAEQLLEMLGATTAERDGKITDVGRKLLSLPVHPRLGRLLLAAAEAGLTREGAAIAALLSEKDTIRPRTDLHPSERRPTTQGPSDLLIRLDVLESRRRDQEVDQGSLRQVLKARDELERIGSRLSRGTGASPVHLRRPAAGAASSMGEAPMPRKGEDALLVLPLFAYPDRVCRRRNNDPAAGVMVGGGGVRLAPESVVRQHEFFLALDARQDQRNLAREAIVHIASKIDPTWLEEMFRQEMRRERRAIYDEQRDRVVGSESVLYRDLVLREHKDAAVNAETAERVLAEWATPRAWDLLREDERAQRWLERLELLVKAMPDKGWPTVSDATAREVVAKAVAGKRTLAQLRPAMLPTLQGFLEYPLDRLMETEAPESIEVPTGNRIKLDYPPQNDLPGDVRPPVLAVRLQELFGMSETPRVAGGRVAVRIHLFARTCACDTPSMRGRKIR